MKILRAKLHQLDIAKQQDEKQALRGAYSEAAWGNQIRSYVLQPYQLVKDHRTGVETTDPDAVLNGELASFMEGYLRWQARPKRLSESDPPTSTSEVRRAGGGQAGKK